MTDRKKDRVSSAEENGVKCSIRVLFITANERARFDIKLKSLGVEDERSVLTEDDKWTGRNQKGLAETKRIVWFFF